MIALILALAMQATTTCTPVGSSIICRRDNGIQPAPPLDYGAIIQQGRNMVPPYQAPQYTAEQLEQWRQDRVRKKVGKLVAKGRCDEAIQVALNAGGFILADNVRTYCAGIKP